MAGLVVVLPRGQASSRRGISSADCPKKSFCDIGRRSSGPEGQEEQPCGRDLQGGVDIRVWIAQINGEGKRRAKKYQIWRRKPHRRLCDEPDTPNAAAGTGAAGSTCGDVGSVRRFSGLVLLGGDEDGGRPAGGASPGQGDPVGVEGREE